MPTTVPRILVAIVAFSGLCFAVWNLVKLLWLTFRGRTASGTVTKMTEWSSRAGHGFTPTVRFADEGGVEHEFRSRSSTEYPNLGMRVIIKYSPSRPGEVAEVDEQLKALTTRYIGLSLLCGFIIVGMYIAK